MVGSSKGSLTTDTPLACEAWAVGALKQGESPLPVNDLRFRHARRECAAASMDP